jgi:hypothetical protein
MCPLCFKGKTVDVAKQNRSDLPAMVKCRCDCGHYFTAIFEKRRHSRKGVSLPGVYIRYIGRKEVEREQMLVVDLSISGMQFILREKRTFGISDKLVVVFNLEDHQKSLIKKEVIVKHINGMTIGAEFCSEDHCQTIKTYLGSILTDKE